MALDRSLSLTASLRAAALDARRGVVRLHADVIAALGLKPGDAVTLTGRRTTSGIVAVAESTASRHLLYADDLILGNLRARDGSQITVTPLNPAPAVSIELAGPAEICAVVSPEMLRLALLGKVITEADNVSLLPQDVATSTPDLVEAANRSLSHALGMGWTSALLTVVQANPAEGALVTMDTVVRWRDGAATNSSATPPPTEQALGQGPPSVDDLAGVRAEAQELRELLDLGFHHADVLKRMGVDAPLGVLITGPAGSGKSTLVRAVAGVVKARVATIWAPELAALEPNTAADRLRRVADDATRGGPVVVLVSDVEALAPRDALTPLGTVFRQVLLEVLGSGAAVVCTTSRPESVDPALRGPDLLTQEIEIPLPDQTGRRDLLEVLCRRVRLNAEVQLDEIAGRTPGFVAADLFALVREAGVRAALRDKDTAAITAQDFAAALEVVRPTSMAGSNLDLGSLTLADVGDMVEVKQQLTEAVLWPLNYPDAFGRLGVEPPRGMLLYGPPGCGKTFLVKAIAGEGKANVLSVKGAELLSKWVGDSERGVRELFRRARQAAPTLIFLDEVDALAPVRGQSTDGGTTDRVVASLLTELDGIESLRNVVVVGATNRPDLIDPALLRPGRLERLVYVPPPDAAARAEILRAAARKVPLGDGIDLPTLAKELDGFSAADCAALIREAALTAMRESIDAATVTASHLATAREHIRPSLDPAQVEYLQSFAENH